MKKKLFFPALILMIWSVPVIAGDFRSGRSVNIDKPQYEDLYISAGNVVINAPVYADLIIAGGTVTINDSVMEDVLIAGGTVMINGYVGDDVRCAGGEVTIGSYVHGDLIAAGGTVKLTSQSSAQSVIVTGGDVYMDGNSRSWVRAAAGNFTLNGTVAENADLRGGKIMVNGRISGKASLAASNDIIFGNSAVIGRSIRYWLPFERPLNMPSSVSVQRPVYDSLLSITYSRWYFLGASTFLGLLWYLGMAFVMIVLLQYLFSSTMSKAGANVIASPMRSALLGLAYFVGVPLAAAIMLVTIIGVPVTALLMVLYVSSLLLATVISSVVITNWVATISGKSWSLWHMSGIALFTFVLLKIIAFTPFFGWLLMIVIAAVAFGAILTTIRFRRTGVSRESQTKVRHIAV